MNLITTIPVYVRFATHQEIVNNSSFTFSMTFRTLIPLKGKIGEIVSLLGSSM